MAKAALADCDVEAAADRAILDVLDTVELVITAGMGRRAQQLFAQSSIDVVVGAVDDNPQKLARQYLDGQLQYGQNICDH